MLRFPDSANLPGRSLGLAKQRRPAALELQSGRICRVQDSAGYAGYTDVEEQRSPDPPALPRGRRESSGSGSERGLPEKRTRALRWTADLKSSAPGPATQPSGPESCSPPCPQPRVARPAWRLPPLQPFGATAYAGAMSGTLECSGGPHPAKREYVFHNVPTVKSGSSTTGNLGRALGARGRRYARLDPQEQKLPPPEALRSVLERHSLIPTSAMMRLIQAELVARNWLLAGVAI